MKLQDKFKNYFILPLIFGIFISIILTVSILILSSKNFTDSKLLDKLSTFELANTNPILYTAHNTIYKKFQKTIYSLGLFKEYYLLFAESYIQGYSQIDDELINRYAKNSLFFQENWEEFFKENFANKSEINYDNSTYLNYGVWHYDNKIRDFNIKGNSAFAYQIRTLTNMLPVLRSVVETNLGNKGNNIELIYFASASSDLFFFYPISNTFYETQSFLNIFKSLTNSPSCTNSDGVTPDYYYFKCRDWWGQVEDAKNSENDIVISDIYKLVNSTTYGLTVCIKFDDPLSKKYNGPSNSLASICADIDINYIYDIFNHFNKELNGYIYVVKVNSEIPLYYPLIINNDMYSNIERFEFELGATYFIEELNDFNSNTLPNLIREYGDDYVIPDEIKNSNKKETLQAVYKGSYMKNGNLTNYSIYPVRLYCDYNNHNQSRHVLSIISVQRPDAMKMYIQQFQDLFYPRLIVQIFLFLIIASILVLISWHLILSIATNIVKPIQNLKFLIQGMRLKDDNNISNKSKEDNKGNNNKTRGDQNEEKLFQNKNSFKKKSGLHSHRIKKYSSIQSNDKSDSSDESDDGNNLEFELEEDTAEIRSAEMNELFEILLQLKNVLSFTSNFTNSSDRNAFFNYIHAKYTFSQVSNFRGKTICDSNVGNLALRLNKYDKAIFHLLESFPGDCQNISVLQRNYSAQKLGILLSEMYRNTRLNNLVLVNPRSSRLKLRQKQSKLSIQSTLRRNTNNLLPYNIEDGTLNSSNQLFFDENNEDINSNQNNSHLPSYFRSNNLFRKHSRMYFDSNIIFQNLSIHNKDLNFNSPLLNSNLDNNKKDRIGQSKSETINRNGTRYLSNKSNISQKNDNIAILIESRYPKLLYAYKKFFKNLRKMIKKLNTDKDHPVNIDTINLSTQSSFRLNSNSNPNMEINFNQTIQNEVNDFNQRIGEYINIDLHVLKEKHSLEAYEYVISEYLIESVKQKDSRRVAEILLEYNEFLLVYKLKFDPKSFNLITTYIQSNVDIEKEKNKLTTNNNIPNTNANNMSSTNNLPQMNLQSLPSENLENLQSYLQTQNEQTSSNPVDELLKYKTEVLNEIGKNFKIFDTIYDNINLDYSTNESYKLFLDKLKAQKKENSATIETPHKILYQKCYYLKGKLAKYCGHYDKALEYFHRSRETMIICDASIIKKSIKQIIKIMSYIKEEIEQDILKEEQTAIKNKIDLSEISWTKENTTATSNQTNIIVNTVTPNVGMFNDDYQGLRGVNKAVESVTNKTTKVNRLAEITKAKIQSKISRVVEIENYIDIHVKALKSFQYMPKDLVILIDISARMQSEKKKIERSLKNVNYFYENYVTSKDRFALFYYANTLNPIISLTEKNYNTYVYVKNLLENLNNSDLNFGIDPNIHPKKESNMCRAISMVYEYLKKKSSDLNSFEKWIVIFTDSFRKEYNTPKEQEIFWTLKNLKEYTKEQIHIIVVGFNMDKEAVRVLLEILNQFSDKSAYVDIDNISSIRSLMKIPGNINEVMLFSHEKYECETKI